MQFKIHKASFIDGQIYGPHPFNRGLYTLTIGERPYGFGDSGGDIYTMAPLARKGDVIVRQVFGRKPEPVLLTEDLYHYPGPHWEPIDDEAKAYCQALKQNGGVEDQLEAAADAIRHPVGASRVARVVADGLKDLGPLVIARNRVTAARETD